MPKVQKEKKQSKAWIFTLNENENYKLAEQSTIDAFIKKLNACKSTKWTFQLERGEECGRLHYQGRIAFKNGKRKPELLKSFSQWNKGDNLTFKVEYDEEGSIKYVHKEETRVSGPWDKDTTIGYIPRDLRGITLRPWQQTVVDSAKQTDNRVVDVIYDPIGNNGKSIICRYIDVYRIGHDMPPVNDPNMLMQAIMCLDKRPLYTFDLPRAMGKDRLTGLYQAIEQIKTGNAFDFRYSFKKEKFDPPRCWVITNSLPDTNYLSPDRWRFWNINKENQLVPHKE